MRNWIGQEIEVGSVVRRLIIGGIMLLSLTACSVEERVPGEHKNDDFGADCLAKGGSWTYSEGNEWDSCTIYP